ncbi:Uncharacterised protein [uncultured archaeon]|nr:Uncharacterised protein [uncultured archaeon]
MDLLTLIAFILAAILAGAAGLHIKTLNRVHQRIEALEHCSVSKEDLYRGMTIAQGSNFTALALTAWMMLFVAIAYLYLLVPTSLPYSYMQISVVASSFMGFFIFGAIVAALAAIVILALDKLLPEHYRGLKPTELYSFYTLSKNTKKFIGLTVPALAISVVSSAFIGTIYPGRSPLAEALALAFLAVSICMLVAPIYKEAWEGQR